MALPAKRKTTSTLMSEMIYGIHAVQALLERAPERFQESLF